MPDRPSVLGARRHQRHFLGALAPKSDLVHRDRIGSLRVSPRIYFTTVTHHISPESALSSTYLKGSKK